MKIRKDKHTSETVGKTAGINSDNSLLRLKAEEKLKTNPSRPGFQFLEADALKLIHELEVHSIELEMQNEALINAKLDEKEAADRYFELFQFAPLGYFSLTRDGDIIEANLYGSQLLGIESAQLRNSRFSFFVSDETKPAFNLFFRSILSKGSRESCVVTLTNKANLARYVNITGFLSEKSDKCLIIISDLTESKRTEIALDESESVFRSIFENSIMGISQAYPEGKLIRINQAYAEMYGYPDTGSMLQDITDNTLKLYANPSDRKNVLEILKKNGYMEPTEFELKRRNGEYFWALVSAKQVRDKTGKLLYLQAEHVDITVLKNAQRALKEIDERYQFILENSGLGIAYYSVDGKILMLNNTAIKNLGGKPSDYIGKNLTEVFGDEAGKIYIERFKAAAISDIPIIYEDHVKMEGIPGWYLSTHTRILNQNGEVDGIHVIADNITELKIAENKLRDSQKKYRNLSQHLEKILEKERSELAMNLHDDLGQRLTALELDLAWIRGRIGVQSPSVKKKLTEMRKMINDIIDSTKEISSLLRPAILFDLGLFPAIISLLKKFEKSSGIRCKLNSATEEINVDYRISLIIYRVIQEALTNIARHSGATKVEISISLTENKIDMSIYDNGKGIAEGEINSITSMGITGIKERVKGVNGILHIKGKKDSGTRITVSIPLNQDDDDKSINY
jgi:PAS domain S-box-containing protein